MKKLLFVIPLLVALAACENRTADENRFSQVTTTKPSIVATTKAPAKPRPTRVKVKASPTATHHAVITHKATTPRPQVTHHASLPQVHGGSFCSASGAHGLSSAGNELTCKAGSDGRLRWRL